MHATVNIDRRLWDRIMALAEARGTTPDAVIEAAIAREEREARFAAIDEAFARLEQAPEEWADHLAERAEWEATLGDGLDAAGSAHAAGEHGKGPPAAPGQDR
jgi:predicted transcriptional regulator